MFGFLKKKLQEAIGTFTKKAEASVDDVAEKQPIDENNAKSIVPEKKPGTKPEKKGRSAEKTHRKASPVKPTKPQKETREKKESLNEAISRPESIIPEPVIENKTESMQPVQIERTIEKRPEEAKKGLFGNLFRKKDDLQPADLAEGPKGIIGKISDSISKISLSEPKFDELFWELELSLLENNVAVEVIDKIKNDLRADLVAKKLYRNQLDKSVIAALKKSIEGLFDVKQFDLIKEARKKKPFIIVLIGINGSGKTTTIAKLVNLFKENKMEPVVAACDTFRAAAIQQLEEHTDRLGVKLIKHDYGSDPAAVAFDAVEHARSKGKDIVLIDTAGRLHSNANLMAELEKVIRVSKPDLKIFVGESIAGNDVVEQVKLFNDKVGIDGIILAKADIDEKGGAAISVSYITKKPILYLGVGQDYNDLEAFDKEKVIEQIGLS